LGTVNVFARELGIPRKLNLAWEAIRGGQERRIDLPRVDHGLDGRTQSRYFAQLAGAGLDARAIELVQWQVKKRIGPLAYVLAGLHAVMGTPTRIRAVSAKHSEEGELVLVGNGRLYGGQFAIFPKADLCDGLLEICVIPRVDWWTLARCGPQLLVSGTLPAWATRIFRADSVELTSTASTPLEVDGELIGHLPARFTVDSCRLRVVVPKGS
jgi:diacylglycerol kinase family enzyme